MENLIGPKRKFALLFGYNGASYQGLQINPGAKTIEDVLRVSLGKLGLIRESNLNELQKIGWSRAARTDKGVHALGQVASMKLLLKVDKSYEMMCEINDILPKDIKILDVMRVGNSFHSKLQCYGRTYKYILPKFMITEHGTSSEELDSKLNLFNECLNKYVGTKAYHNFTKRTAYNDPSRKRYITKCEARKLPSDLDWIEVAIEGQSFLLNQIRNMVGLASQITRRGLSSSVVDDALKSVSETKFLVPMAPGEGLLLQSCSFPKYNKKMCVSPSESDEYVGKETSENLKRRPVQFEVGKISERSDSFFKEQILPAIFRAESENKIFSEWVNNEKEKTLPIIVEIRRGEYTDYDNYKEKKRKDKQEHRIRVQNRAKKVENGTESTGQ